MELYDVMSTTFACREFVGEGASCCAVTANGYAIPAGIAEEDAVKALLGIPSHWAVATIMPLGKPAKQLTKLKRKPVEEILFANSWSGDSTGRTTGQRPCDR